MNEIMVSVLCTAYNHEKYIRDALDGFVAQKTNFRYEVLVNDDASTDATAAIIKEYENKYPEIIHGVYQKENQYMKVSITKDILIPLAKGKYIAICEGDDYWVDNFKLQKQYDIMENNPNINMCASRAYLVSANTKAVLGEIAPEQFDTILSVEQVIRGGGGYVATASLFYRKEIIFDSYTFPRVCSMDYFMQIHGALFNGIYYLNDCMSVYRWMADGSWTSRIEMDPSKAINFKDRTIYALDVLNKETNFRYDTIIKDVILETEFDKLVYMRDIKQIMTQPYRSLYDKKSAADKIKIQIKCRVPFAFQIRRWLAEHGYSGRYGK